VRRYLLVCVLLGCGGDPQNGEVCEATAQVEQACSNGVDEDCDGFTDCLDNECDGQQCGMGDGYTCLAGACLKPGALPPLPRIDNLRVTMHADTAIIDFEGVAGAKDYRVYTLPADEDVLVGEQGEVAIKNAIYRCAGERPRYDREHDAIGQFARSIAGGVRNYTRTEAESILGYVYLTPAADRVPVYRVADPNLRGGYVWEYGSPPAKEYNGADYVTTIEQRDALVAQGWRDDGIAFYIPAEGTRPIYRRYYMQDGAVLFYTDGAEATARAGDNAQSDSGERFKILATEEPGSVPLHRVFYAWANEHDTLAAGEANFQLVLHQGSQPVTSVTWPGLTDDTTLVIEALDGGCPFAGAYIGGSAAPESTRFTYAYPTLTVDQARLSSGEVFINGQAEPTSRPKPIARGYVNVTPEPHPDMDWFQSFDIGAAWEPMQELIHDGNGNVVLRNSVMSAEFGSTVDDAFSYGPMLGQFYVGSTTSVRLVARGVSPTLSADSYLHVTMSTSIPSTNRRYPQIWITTTPEVTQADVPHSFDVPLESRLGPFPFEHKPPGDNDTIVVQPFTANHEMQIQVCNNRGWGVSQQCDRANVYGFSAGTDQMQPWTTGVDWTPMPVIGELAGLDRPVKIDVYASTSRVYVYVEDKPAGCAVIPSGQLNPGAYNVVFGTSGYHIDIDESVVPDYAPYQYWKRYHLFHVERLFDDLGISKNTSRPAWDDARMPCGTHWYGGTTE
jgi:hypothetical protein